MKRVSPIHKGDVKTDTSNLPMPMKSFFKNVHDQLAIFLRKKQTNKHTPANAIGIGPAHKEQESQRSSLVTQTSVSET